MPCQKMESDAKLPALVYSVTGIPAGTYCRLFHLGTVVKHQLAQVIFELFLSKVKSMCSIPGLADEFKAFRVASHQPATL